MPAASWRRAAVAVWTTATVCVLGACGGSAGDILALEVAGGFQGEPVRLTVTEDGRGSCDGSELRPIPSERLIEARELERELEPLARDGAAFEDTAAADRRSYVARSNDGVVRWTEGAPNLPEVLPRAQLLAQDLIGDLCGEGGP
jgi:hypothetical protein